MPLHQLAIKVQLVVAVRGQVMLQGKLVQLLSVGFELSDVPA